MRVCLEYGKTGLNVELPDDPVTRVLTYKTALPLSDPLSSLCALLENPIASHSLEQMAQNRQDACILICDITRPVPNHLFLRPMIETMIAVNAEVSHGVAVWYPELGLGSSHRGTTARERGLRVPGMAWNAAS